MPLVLVADVGGAASNTYATLLEAAAYHEAHPYASAWTALTVTDDQRNRALATATRLLDERVEWDGAVVNDVQALLWPRSGMVYRSGYAIPTTVLPQGLKDATAELARQLLASDRTADSDAAAQGLTRIKAGPVELEFDRATATQAVIPDAVYAMVALWGREKRRTSVCIPLVRA